ncbi:hypothetical protein TYRP_022726 [Tyrophagus putrescentiae]|nr:hypothetical protein TYRP_022726 [Tyrophagus putrescentiae]
MLKRTSTAGKRRCRWTRTAKRKKRHGLKRFSSRRMWKIIRQRTQVRFFCAQKVHTTTAVTPINRRKTIREGEKINRRVPFHPPQYLGKPKEHQIRRKYSAV